MAKPFPLLRWAPWLALALLAAFPLVAPLLGMDFYIGFVRRALVFALAAASLNFILGFGGMVALGHAGFMGLGAYTLVALADAGVASAWLLWPAALAVAALAALAIGAVALRTRGVYFIMITLAFAQMLYYICVSLRTYGGDDGYNLQQRPALGLGLDSAHGPTFYWVVLVLFALVMALFNRATQARFGQALQGIRDNETRMHAMGYPVLRVQLVAFAIAAGVAGLAGALLVSHNSFVSPGVMHWTQSATLIVMVVIGGVGRRWGGPVGAAVWILLEEVVKQHTDYWHLPLGLLLIAIVFLAPRGIAAVFDRRAEAAR
ncbi:branched-chain amino acid ABC transporter permease [uncultured Ramlibacter sp.]|uniref:branched-chain amino acid ABC transporter permease n=1 Tax=uncultured Ramlibacter sp. TaxID=260755 RepID=UPI00262BD42D|nr:branched-chain amino acid ABC transporter permease [uncultured Ramlibacter sp.]